MIRYAHVWVFGVAMWMWCAGASEVDPLMRDARMVHDVAELRFDAGAPWVLVKVSPSESSGGATIPGAVIDGKNADRKASRSGQTRIFEQGSWNVIEALDRYDGLRQGTYAWTKPARTHARTTAPDDVYSPFSMGGTVACKLDSSLPSQAAFQTPFLMPPQWEKQLRAAYQQFKKNPDRSPNSENEIVAVMSFRAAAERGAIPIERVRQALRASRGYERSALIYVLLTSRSAGMEVTLQAELERLVRESSVPEQHSLALGVFAARLFHPELYTDRLTQSLTASLLQAPDAYLKRTLLGN